VAACRCVLGLIEGVLKKRDLKALAARVATKKETAAGR
jgi:hypothetical protein